VFVDGGAYDAFMGRWSRLLAPELVRFGGVRDGDVVLDVGCGTGSLAAAVVAASPTGTVLGVDPSPGFVDIARSAVPAGRFEVGDAQALQFHDGTFTRTLSLLVLNFVPDPHAAVREMIRVTQPGGTIAVAVWDYRGGMQMLAGFWDEAMALRDSAEPRDERQMPLCQPYALGELWREHGFGDVVEQPLRIQQQFSSFDDYWLPFMRGVGPAGSYVADLDEPARAQLRERLRSRLLPAGVDGPFTLTAQAFAVRGTVPVTA
jgi:SAM-dependent methyltransferase